ncbi:MAG: hypothetical protein IJ991_06560, partial [Thermoguttaceae bacterium]|nr:hypothetical protein [Thermoguttaceae bacterium]
VFKTPPIRYDSIVGAKNASARDAGDVGRRAGETNGAPPKSTGFDVYRQEPRPPRSSQPPRKKGKRKCKFTR